MIQIETKLGVENLDAILTACPEIDIVWLGTLDARISMSLPANQGMGGSEPEWLEVVDLYEKTLKKHDKPRGGFAFAAPPFGTTEGFKKAVDTYALITMSADVLQLYMMSQDLVMSKTMIAEVVAEREASLKKGENGTAEELAVRNGKN